MRGIGLAAAVRFAAEGWSIVLNDIDAAGLSDAANRLKEQGASVTKILGDVADPTVVESMVTSVISSQGHIEALVNNAAVIRFAPLLEYDTEDLETTFRTNVFGAFHATRAVARRWVAEGATGSIVMVTSVSSSQARPGHSAYGSSKAALEMLARNAAMELGPHGIRVNCVSPGGPILTELVEPVAGSVEFQERVRESVPLRRMGTPEEVAGVIYFLATSDASYVNGAVVTVDGGVSLGRA